MTQAQVLRKIKRQHWRTLERMMKVAYQEGLEAGLARAHGRGRRGRTIRGDAKVPGSEGLRQAARLDHDPARRKESLGGGL